MRHLRSQCNFRQYQPKRGIFGFLKARRRKIDIADSETVGRYSNPYKIHQTPKAKKRLPVAKILLFGSAASWAILAIYLPYFRVYKVRCDNDTKVVKSAEIIQAVETNFILKKGFIPSNNYFLLSKDKIEAFLMESFPLQLVKVEKHFPNEIRVSFEERISSVVYDNGGKYYLLDEKGTAIKQLLSDSVTTTIVSTTFNQSIVTTTGVLGIKSMATTTALDYQPDFKKITNEFGKMPIVYKKNSDSIYIKKTNILDESIIRGVIDFYNGLEQGSAMKVNYFLIDDQPSGVTAFINKPWKIFFQPSKDIKAQLNSLKVVLNDNQPTEYVDLRYDNRIFWK